MFWIANVDEAFEFFYITRVFSDTFGCIQNQLYSFEKNTVPRINTNPVTPDYITRSASD